MNRKIIISTTLIAGMGLAVMNTFADTPESTPTWSPSTGHQWHAKHMSHGKGYMRIKEKLTDTEKAQFETLSPAEKKAFLEKKRADMEADHQARQAVIDKVLAGTPLTSDEETLRQTIITDRAAHEAQVATMKAKMEQVKAIFEKKKAGTALTSDEQAILDSLPKFGNHSGKWMMKRDYMDRMTSTDTSMTTTQ